MSEDGGEVVVKVGQVRSIMWAPQDEVPIAQQEADPWYAVVVDIK